MNIIKGDNASKAHAEMMMVRGRPESNSLNRFGGRCDFGGRRWTLPEFNRDCMPRPQDPSEGIQKIVEQFTTLFQGIFQALDSAIQGLIGLAKEPPAAEPQPETPPPATTTPPEAQPAPSAPAPEAPAPSAPSGEPSGETNTRDQKEAEPLGKTGEFLWKPVSDKDGKLAVIIPGDLTGRVKSVKIVDADGKVIEKGDYSGTGNPMKNGEREHYRFNKEGGKYPDGCYIHITMNSGKIKKVKIGETSNRFEK